MANNQQLTLALRIRADLNDAQDALRRLNGNVDELGQSTRTAARDADQLNAATQRIGGGMTALAASIKAAALGLGALFSIREIIQTTDAWTNLQNRLRLVTSTQAQLAAVTADVYRIAQLTSSALDSTATVYQRFAQNADRLNISQRQVASLTDTVAKSIAISGASAQSAEAALVQFGQALASGVLRGEEFNSVSEQAPALLKAIADGLNVNIGELRKMANEGQLTADVLVDALSNAAAGVNDQFATRIKTVSMAVQELENAFTRLVGEFTNGRGAGEALAGAISGVANVMDGLSDNAELLGTALDAVMVTAAGRAVAAITGLTTTWLSNAAASRAAASPPLRKQRPTKAPPWRHSEPLPRSYNGPRPLSPRQRPRWPPAAPARPPVSRTFGTSRPLWLRSARWSRPGFRRRSPILVGSSPSLAWLSYGCPKRPLSGRSRPQRRRSHPRRWRLRPPSPPPISAGPPQSRQPLRHNRL